MYRVTWAQPDGKLAASQFAANILMLNSAWQDHPDSVQDSVFVSLSNLFVVSSKSITLPGLIFPRRVVNGSLAIPSVVALGLLVLQLIHFSVSGTTSHFKSKPGLINLPVADADNLDDITLDSNPSGLGSISLINLQKLKS